MKGTPVKQQRVVVVPHGRKWRVAMAVSLTDIGPVALAAMGEKTGGAVTKKQAVELAERVEKWIETHPNSIRRK